MELAFGINPLSAAVHCILKVFDALRTFARPATRVELERESGLDANGVRKGLDGLDRRGVLVMDGEPRKLSTYTLQPGTERPTDLRGRRPGQQAHRAARPAVAVAKVSAKPRKVLIGATRRKAHGIPEETAGPLLDRIWSEKKGR